MLQKREGGRLGHRWSGDKRPGDHAPLGRRRRRFGAWWVSLLLTIAAAVISWLLGVVPSKSAEAILAEAVLADAVEPGDLQCYVPLANVRVLDGDTLVADILLPFGVTLRGEHLRACDYDAWEVSRHRQSVDVTDAEIEKGKAAKAAVEQLIGDSEGVYIRPNPAGRDRDVYGRVLAKFSIVKKEGPVVDLGRWMRARHYVRPEE